MKRNLRVFVQVAIVLTVCTFFAAQYLARNPAICSEGDPTCSPRIPTEKSNGPQNVGSGPANDHKPFLENPAPVFDVLESIATTTTHKSSSERPSAVLDDLESIAPTTTTIAPSPTKQYFEEGGFPSNSEDEYNSSQSDFAEATESPADIEPAEPTPTVNIEEVVRDTLQKIMNPETRPAREGEVACPEIDRDRYGYLDVQNSTYAKPHLATLGRPKKFFFALDLFQCVPVLPSLMATVVEVLKYLGPENCVVSIVEGRSLDGTREVLEALEKQIVSLGAEYFLFYNDVDPHGPGANRIEALADLRNNALDDIFRRPEHYDPGARIIYINDIVLCPEDVLEMLHQHISQEMDQACAMDWINLGDAFYDVWVSRSMTGDIFFEITQGVDWKFSQNLFWDHKESKKRYLAKQPTQVYACWNGITVLNAQPFLRQEVIFRYSDEANGECYMGEPTLLAKDLWKRGYNRIAVVPSVNVGYSDFETNATKVRRGTTRDNVAFAAEQEELEGTVEKITWEGPPGQVKCLPVWEEISWVPPF